MFSTTGTKYTADTIIVGRGKILTINEEITSSVILNHNATVVFIDNGSIKTDAGDLIALTGQSITNKLETPTQLSIADGVLELTTVELSGGAADFAEGSM